jgi:hypothetical protein
MLSGNRKELGMAALEITAKRAIRVELGWFEVQHVNTYLLNIR